MNQIHKVLLLLLKSSGLIGKFGIPLILTTIGSISWWWANNHFECLVVDKNDLPLETAEVTITSEKDNNQISQVEKTGSRGTAPFKTPDSTGKVNIRVVKEKYKVHNDSLNPGWSLDSRLKKIRLEKIETPPPPPPPPPNPCKKNPNWCEVVEPGEDGNGNSADFTFYTLIGAGSGYRWTLASDETIDVVGTNIETQKAVKLLDSKISKLKIDNDAQIIGVGSASCEGDNSTEKNRAERRANVVISSVREHFSNRSYMLILGKYNDKNCTDKNPELTSLQRSVIVVAFRNIKEIDKSKPLDREKAAKSAFRKVLKNPEFIKALQSNFKDKVDSPLGRKIDIDKYDDFVLTQ
jgi:hypothetical protein